MGRGRYSGRGPKGYSRSDDRIKEDVSERLEQHPDVDASDIEVIVKAGEVTLEGTVEDRRQKRMAEEAVESCQGVKDVHNHLKAKQGFMSSLFGGDDSEKDRNEKDRNRESSGMWGAGATGSTGSSGSTGSTGSTASTGSSGSTSSSGSSKTGSETSKK